MARIVVPGLHQRVLLPAMKVLQLQLRQHDIETGDTLPALCPNVTEDTLIQDESGQIIGGYLTSLPERLASLASIADVELRSSRVPKSLLERAVKLQDVIAGKGGDARRVQQYSAILGSIPPKVIMRRPYATRSSVHAHESARVFAKAMNAAGKEILKLIRSLDEGLYERHRDAVERHVPERWRFGGLFSSTISNCNISASVHRDNRNVKGAVNAIICKRRNAVGGRLHVPDYGATFEQGDGSLLVYPAWRNSHGVTPIVPTHRGGYRNTLIWYALCGFEGGIAR